MGVVAWGIFLWLGKQLVTRHEGVKIVADVVTRQQIINSVPREISELILNEINYEYGPHDKIRVDFFIILFTLQLSILNFKKIKEFENREI